MMSPVSMPAPLDFYFDFSSPYGYIASEKIDPLAAKYGRTVRWRPMLLGAAFKAAGTVAQVEMPLKGDYAKRDFARSARFHGIPFNYPDPFPVPTVHAARAFFWAEERDPAKARALAHALYRGYFVDNVNISEAGNVVARCEGVGLDRGAAESGVADPRIKDRLRASVDEALSRGVFGSPFVFADGEPFWGVDRFDQLERWLAQGGF